MVLEVFCALQITTSFVHPCIHAPVGAKINLSLILKILFSFCTGTVNSCNATFKSSPIIPIIGDILPPVWSLIPEKSIGGPYGTSFYLT